jgi:hypothetical protein
VAKVVSLGDISQISVSLPSSDILGTVTNMAKPRARREKFRPPHSCQTLAMTRTWGMGERPLVIERSTSGEGEMKLLTAM